MTGIMRGICKMQPGKGAEYRTDIPIPSIRSDEVLIRTRAAAICGTDLHIYDWNEYAANRMKRLPMVFGHEVCGEIVELGANVKDLSVGDRISVETHIPCNHCPQCMMGNRHICENMKLFGVTEPGAFAEYAAVPAACAVQLDDDITDQMGALLESMGAGVHGVERAEVKGKNVLVSGCGPIGLMVIGACKQHKAHQIIACDVLDQKLELAKVMGADVVLNSGTTDIPETVRLLTNGSGADAAIDITGNGKAIVTGLRALRKAGRMVSVGLPNGEIPLNLTEDIIYREIEYTGVAGRRMFETWDDCLQILRSGKFSLKPVIGGVYKLEEFETALAAIRSGVPGKMLLIP
jgi:threonine 3-dehydrogenase